MPGREPELDVAGVRGRAEFLAGGQRLRRDRTILDLRARDDLETAAETRKARGGLCVRAGQQARVAVTADRIQPPAILEDVADVVAILERADERRTVGTFVAGHGRGVVGQYGRVVDGTRVRAGTRVGAHATHRAVLVDGDNAVRSVAVVTSGEHNGDESDDAHPLPPHARAAGVYK